MPENQPETSEVDALRVVLGFALGELAIAMGANPEDLARRLRQRAEIGIYRSTLPPAERELMEQTFESLARTVEATISTV